MCITFFLITFNRGECFSLEVNYLGSFSIFLVIHESCLGVGQSVHLLLVHPFMSVFASVLFLSGAQPRHDDVDQAIFQPEY